jgi:hypothetical protein
VDRSLILITFGNQLLKKFAMDVGVNRPEGFSWHFPEILIVLMSCYLIQNDFARRIIDAGISKKLITFDSETRRNAIIRTVGLAHSSVVGAAALWIFMTGESFATVGTYQQRLWGFNESISRLNACCLGYFLWEIVILLLDPRPSKGMLVHCLCALLLLCVTQLSV